MYKIVKSLFHIALIAICVSAPFAASAGVGTEPSAMAPSDLTSSTMPLMTPPEVSAWDAQANAMPSTAVPGSEVQTTADSRAITPSYPAPSFKADMMVAQNSDPYAATVTPSYMDMSNMVSSQQYTTTSQYQLPVEAGQYPQQYNNSMAVPPYPNQGTQQPWMQGTSTPYAYGLYQGNQPYLQGAAAGMMPYDSQGMIPQMQGMEMLPYGVQQQQYISVEQLYNQAMQSYRSRDYQGAMIRFQEVAGRFPQSDLADNAHYWIGEIYYNTKNYPAAIQSFQTVIQMYPQGNKVPDAMVKMGFAYADIGQHNIARSILNDVSMRFSDNARIRNLAVKKLNALNNLY